MTVWHSQSPRFVRRDCNRFRNHDFDEPLQHQLGMGKKERKDVNADIRKEQLVEMCGKKKKLLGYGSLHTFLSAQRARPRRSRRGTSGSRALLRAKRKCAESGSFLSKKFRILKIFVRCRMLKFGKMIRRHAS